MNKFHKAIVKPKSLTSKAKVLVDYLKFSYPISQNDIICITKGSENAKKLANLGWDSISLEDTNSWSDSEFKLENSLKKALKNYGSYPRAVLIIGETNTKEGDEMFSSFYSLSSLLSNEGINSAVLFVQFDDHNSSLKLGVSEWVTEKLETYFNENILNFARKTLN